MCQHNYFLDYVLNKKPPGNIKADKGNIVHKALELLARKKLAIQNGDLTFSDDETGSKFSLSMTEEDAIQHGWHVYTEFRPTVHQWSGADLVDCRSWMHMALNHDGGLYNPLNRHIIAPEQYFDMVIDEPWAHYDYTLPDGTKLTGQLGIKGTVDLVTRTEEGFIEYIDWKTGRRWDWAKDCEKTYAKIRDDFQLRMYHYALSKLYPDESAILMTIMYVKDGGPFPIHFGNSDLPIALGRIRKRFEEIKRNRLPKQNKTWKCKAFCYWGKNKAPGTQKTLCDFYHDELVELGMDRMLTKHADLSKIASYGDGGGKSAKEVERE